MLKVYNTMTRSKEEFKPLKEGEASIYCCGVTPYNHPHIGNARPFVTWDVIRRYLAHKGYKVRYIQNFTDVDDKIIRTANEEGVKWSDISGRYIDAYFKAMDALNVKRADIYPRVSETIPAIRTILSRSGRGLKTLKITNNALVSRFIGSKDAAAPVMKPFTPDGIVYCKSEFIYIDHKGPEDLLKQAEKKIEAYIE